MKTLDKGNFKEQLANFCFAHDFVDSDEQAYIVCSRYYDDVWQQKPYLDEQGMMEFCPSLREPVLILKKVFSYLREDCGFKVEMGEQMNDEGKCISTCGLVKKVNEFTFAVWPTNDSEVAFRMIVPKNKDDYYMNELHLNFVDFRIGQLLPYGMAGLFQKLMVRWFSVFQKDCIVADTTNFCCPKK